MAKKASADPTSVAVEALTRTLANPIPLKMHGTKANPGIFLSSAQKMKDAAKLCLQNGWLEGTGEFVGKGKSAKETYRITQKGADFALENGEVPTLLNDLLLANDSQSEVLRQLEAELQRAAQATGAQNRLLQTLSQQALCAPATASPVAPPTPATPPVSTSGGAWLQQIVQHVRQFRRDHPHRSCPFSELYQRIAQPAGVSIGQFHDGLRQLARDRQISLEPWTGAMSDLEDDHLALVLAKETKFYADPL